MSFHNSLHSVREEKYSQDGFSSGEYSQLLRTLSIEPACALACPNAALHLASPLPFSISVLPAVFPTAPYPNGVYPWVCLERMHHNKNFAQYVSLWDSLLGTNFIPTQRENLRFGVQENGVKFEPRGVVDLYVVPFLAIYRALFRRQK